MSDENSGNQLGSGSYSGVYRDTHKCIAIKTFKDKNSSNALKEIAIMRYLDHKNIIYCTSAEYNDGIWKIYMKLYDVSLSKPYWLYRRQIDLHPIEYLTEMLYNVISAMAYMHEALVIHGDIKPDNILHTFSGRRTAICDFNLAVFNPEGQLSTCIQTPLYRAPEVNSEVKLCKFDYKIDVWSFGCIMYELLTSRVLIQKCYKNSLITISELFDTTDIQSVNDLSDWSLRVLEKSKWRMLMHVGAAKSISEKFIQKYSFIMSKCLLPDPRKRSSGREIKAMFEDMLLPIFSMLPNTDLPSSKPLCALSVSEDIISESLEELTVTPKPASKQEKALLMILKSHEIGLFISLNISIKLLSRLIEINYYKKSSLGKKECTSESILVYSACIYIACCIHMCKPSEDIYKYNTKKEIYSKAVQIMNKLNYDIIS